MRRRRRIWVIFGVMLLCPWLLFAQKLQNNLTATDDDLILLIDMRSPVKSIDSILNRAGLGKADAAKVKQQHFEDITSAGWQLTKRRQNIVQFNRPVVLSIDAAPGTPYLLTTQAIETEGRPGYPALPLYGVNKLAKATVNDIANGYTRFMLLGYAEARHVQLSGSFNDWTTTGAVMKHTPSGWIYDVKLKPGIYAYKFIIDGNWKNDNNNLLAEDDGFDGRNSIYYKYNHLFKLNGYSSARQVSLKGSFLGSGTLPLQKTSGGWQVPMYLRDGSHTYQFIVDGKPITDPVNKAVVNGQSVINMGQLVSFKLKGYQQAKQVFVAGGFNKWNPRELKLKKARNGWVLPVILPEGNYGYKFIVDGNWITDPANLCSVFEGGQQNSFIASRANHTFRLPGYSNAKNVYIAGTFNNWNDNQYKLCRKGDDWTIALNVPQGKVRYKFIVDGEWLQDPANKLWEPNEHGTGNSVIWISNESQ